MNTLKHQDKVFDGRFNFLPKVLKYNGAWGGQFAMSTSGGSLGACGATTGNGCGGQCVNSATYTEDHLQDFLYFVIKTLNKRTLYYLPVTYQMPLLKQVGSFLWMMKEIGAKEVHVSPNRIHGPNLMHLWVYDPGCPEAVAAKEKLMVLVTYTDRYGYKTQIHIPRHVWEADQRGDVVATPEVAAKPVPKPQVTWAKQPPPRPAGPMRDKYGRFTSKRT